MALGRSAVAGRREFSRTGGRVGALFGRLDELTGFGVHRGGCNSGLAKTSFASDQTALRNRTGGGPTVSRIGRPAGYTTTGWKYAAESRRGRRE
jgi:hypothetical protein